VADYFRPLRSAQVGTFEVGASGVGTDPELKRLTVLQQYWAAFAEVLEYLHQRACALLDEMFCATTTELRQEWGIDYGYPDPCEPWDALCEKVRAQGGATCAYLAELAARLGYTIECLDYCPNDGAAADCAIADCTPVAHQCVPNRIVIRILSAESPAMVNPPIYAADAAVADCTPPCSTPDQVICLIERFKPAHVLATYEVI